MSYEIDFLAVGENGRSGDAIALRIGNLSGQRSEQKVLVIDGGSKDSGEALVSHINRYYGTDFVDIVMSTHPDSDHSSGLAVVLEKMKVGCLFMHQPWNHAEDIKHLFDDERVTPTGLEERAWRSLENARELEKTANRKGIPIREPFSDSYQDVLSPSKAFYQQQLANFRCMPEPAKKAGLLTGHRQCKVSQQVHFGSKTTRTATASGGPKRRMLCWALCLTRNWRDA